MKVPHPNAIIGGSTGVGGGALAVYVLGRLGVSLTPYEGAILAGVISSAVLFVGRNGLRGVWRLILRGKG